MWYRNGHVVNTSDPGGDLAGRIRNEVSKWEPPFFVTVYGGLAWTAQGNAPKEEFWYMLKRTMDALGSG